MRRFYPNLFSASAMLFAVLFLGMPIQTHAEDICCKCVPQNMSEPPTLCYTVPSLKSGDNCSTLPTEQNMNGLDCDPKKLTAAQCKKLSGSGSGICTTDPEPAKPTRLGELVSPNTDSNSSASSSLLPTALEFNTPIPQFKAPTDMGLLFASYVIAIYRYMISIAVFVATVMFIWGAFRYLVGSGVGGVARGKQIMSDAVIGLILVFSASLILRTINPELLYLKTLTINQIKTEIYKEVPQGQLSKILGLSKIPTRIEMLNLVKETAKKTGIPDLPCIVYASMINESGGKFVIGHDENARVPYAVDSRIAFLKSGKKYSGETFTPLECKDTTCQIEKIFNDDDLVNLEAPPDYGLDWRFSHGIGPAQSTIFPKNTPCPDKSDQGRGFRMGGKCYTVPELMRPENVAEIMVFHFKSCYLSAQKDIAKTYICYGGQSLTPDDAIIEKRIADFEACQTSK